MRAFQDNQERTWEININVATLKRVKGALQVDLLDISEGKLFEQLVSDPVLLCNLIYVICKPEADAKEISDEDFGVSMAGDAIEEATQAFIEELISFFPKPRRNLLTKALSKMEEVEQTILETAEKILDGPELDNRVEAIIKDLNGKLFTNLPESSE